MAFILVFFLICTACGKPADQATQSSNQANDDLIATDVNFIGGGTQAPELIEEEEPYRSPTLSTPPPPTTLNWAPSIQHAMNAAEKNERYRIMAWFTNKNCIDCPVIERNVFTDGDVISASRDWIFVEIDTDKNLDAAEYYLAGASPPAFLAMDKLGHAYKRYYGSITAEDFKTLLETWN